jgi:hypothetical protein
LSTGAKKRALSSHAADEKLRASGMLARKSTIGRVKKCQCIIVAAAESLAREEQSCATARIAEAALPPVYPHPHVRALEFLEVGNILY